MCLNASRGTGIVDVELYSWWRWMLLALSRRRGDPDTVGSVLTAKSIRRGRAAPRAAPPTKRVPAKTGESLINVG